MNYGISSGRANAWLFALFLFVLPLGTRLFLASFTGEPPNDGNAAFLYLSDLALLAFLFTASLGFFSRSQRLSFDAPVLFLAGLSAVSLASVVVAQDRELALWQTLKLLEGALLFLIVRQYIGRGNSLKLLATALIVAGLGQSLLATAQFDLQSSLGLTYLGEPALGLEVPSSAKFFVDGEKIVRPAGTLPHANVLAGFLLAPFLALWYIWLRLGNSKRLLLFGLALFPLLLGLTLSFSRSGWIAFFAIVAVGAFWLLRYQQEYRRRLIMSGAVLIVLLIFLAIIFFPYIRARVPAADEPAVADRLFLNRAAITMLREHPWLGVGMGNFVVNLPENSTTFELNNSAVSYAWWEQPAHNIFLLVASELGILGLSAFLGLLVTLWLRSSWAGRLVLLGLAIIMMTDHYLWTMQQGRLLFWLGLGVAAATGEDKETE